MLNVCTVAGRLTRPPELRYTNANIPVCSFSIACERDIKNADGERETDFINVTAWRKTAEFVCNYFTQGDMITVSGRLTQNRYTDKDGKGRSTHEISADGVYFGGTRKDKPGSDMPGDKLSQLHSNYPDITQFKELDADGELPF